MADFAEHIDALIEKEGGYKLVDHPADNGGRTYAGISENWNRGWPGWLDINRGQWPQACQVQSHYRVNYWQPIQGDKLESDLVAEAMLSCSVLSSPSNAVRLAQRVCNVTVDGIMGPKTLDAVNKTPAREFVMALALARIARFCEIVERDPSKMVFFRGWTMRVLRELA